MAKRKTAEEKAAEDKADLERWLEAQFSDVPPVTEDQIRSLRRILFSKKDIPEDS